VTSADYLKRALMWTFVGANLLIGYYNWAARDGAVAGRTDASTVLAAAAAAPPTASAAVPAAPVPPPPPSRGETVAPKEAAPPPSAVNPPSAGGTPISFERGSARLLPDGKQHLVGVFNRLSSNPSASIELCGHTDDKGDPLKNLELSIQRAKAVADYLLAFGIARERIVVQGLGSAKPIADNETEGGRRRNNRVDVVEIGVRR
jgi:outer membrane protein OmpA-like peptidoglycan-associated protein